VDCGIPSLESEPTANAFFTFDGYSLVTLEQMAFANCNTNNTYGLYRLGAGGQLSDSDSAYSLVSGVSGAIYNFVGSTISDDRDDDQHTVTLTANTYSDLNARSGSVLFALDLIIFTSTACTYQYLTINSNGGAFYASQSSTYSQTASITSYQDTFSEIYAGLDTSTGFGGVIYVSEHKHGYHLRGGNQ